MAFRPPVKPGQLPSPFDDPLYSLMSAGGPIPRDPSEPPLGVNPVVPPPVNSVAPGGDPTLATPPLGQPGTDKAPAWYDKTKGGSQLAPQTPWNGPDGKPIPPPQYPNVPGLSNASGAGAGGPIQNQNLYGGFNFQRAQDPSKSAKDAFASLSNAVAGSDDRWKLKATAGAFFDEHIRPGLEALGYTVGQVIGDMAFISTRENPEGTWIDWVQNADGPNPMLAWQDQSYMGDEGGGAASGGGGGLDPTGRTSIDDGGLGLPGGGSGDNSDYIQQIIEELSKIIGGNPDDLLGGALAQQLTRR